MPSVVTVVDDYIKPLLRDACIRIGLYPARTKALEWGKLLSTNECNDNAQHILPFNILCKLGLSLKSSELNNLPHSTAFVLAGYNPTLIHASLRRDSM